MLGAGHLNFLMMAFHTRRLQWLHGTRRGNASPLLHSSDLGFLRVSCLTGEGQGRGDVPCPASEGRLPPSRVLRPLQHKVLFVRLFDRSLRPDTLPWDVSKQNLANNTVSSGHKAVFCGQLGYFSLSGLLTGTFLVNIPCFPEGAMQPLSVACRDTPGGCSSTGRSGSDPKQWECPVSALPEPVWWPAGG